MRLPGLRRLRRCARRVADGVGHLRRRHGVGVSLGFIAARAGPVRFVARNTLIIFLAHMPLYYALLPLMMRWQIRGAARSDIYFVLCLPGLALVSEAVRRVVQPHELRDRLYARLHRLAA